ncbi:MAG: GAF domain-containing protein, partial [Candidatus Rokubacteria bacterium]|nr:GAF domain-containing protein [Candidatus Rokubacteria bacterium]
MKIRQRFARALGLREVSATIFALIAILPLLVFLFLLWVFDLLGETHVQVSLLLALTIALLGFVLFQRLVEKISTLAQTLASSKPAEQAAPPGEASPVLPGFGQVTEISQIAEAFGRLLEDLRGSTERLEDLVYKLGTLNEMVELAARIPKMQELLGLVLQRTMRTVRATIGSIMLLDRERQTLRIAASHGLPEDVIGGTEVGLGDGIAGKVVQLGEPVLVEDIETDPRFAKAADPKYGGGSFICMPVRVGDRVTGVINLAKKEYGAASPPHQRPFSNTDLQFLNALMTYIAYALDNARLLEEARQSALRLQEVVEDQKLRLTLAQQQMLQAEKLSALSQIVAGVAHELNNPLSVVMGQTVLLRETAGGGALAQRAEKIFKAAERCSRIVKNFLALARQHPPERHKVAFDQIVKDAVEVLAYPLRLDGVEVKLDLAPDLPVLWADPHQLHQVVVNLISNAHQA